MNLKKIVLSSLTPQPTISAKTRIFSQDEIDKGDMAKYIETKTRSRHHCHVFDYTETFKTESTLSRSTSQ